jgi:hypothetical protein
VTTANSHLIIDDAGWKDQLAIPTGVAKLQKITMDRAAGAWSNHNIDVDDNVPADSVVLVLTNGILMMADSANGNGTSDTLFMNSFAVERMISLSDASHVDGVVSRWIWNDGAWSNFPCGDDGNGRSVALKATSLSAGNNWNTCRLNWFAHHDYQNYNVAQLPGGVNSYYYWSHSRVSSANVARRFYYEESDFQTPYITEVTIANYTSTWSETTTPITYNTTEKYIEQQSPNASNDEDWTWGGLTANSMLPIELIAFAGIEQNKQVLLQWTTAWEINNAFFEIERSTDGINFESIGQVAGSGTSHEFMSYQFIDDAPQAGYNYYRLRQVDYDLAFEYSNVIAVEVAIEETRIGSPYPNPAESVLQIPVEMKGETDLEIAMYNMMGQEVIREQQHVAGATILMMDVSSVRHGAYIVRISQAGEPIYTTQLVKR